MTTVRVVLLGCALSAGLAACLPCADCCPPGSGPTAEPLTVACRVVRTDGGPASGLDARCVHSDAGATTDGTGAFSLTATRLTCGFAAGSNDCFSVQFFEDGGLLTVAQSTTPDAGATEASAFALTGGTCQLIAR